MGASDASRLGVDFEDFEPGLPSTGVGGRAETRIVPTILTLDDSEFAVNLVVPVPDPGRPSSPIPSILGRDVLLRYAIFIEERTERIRLLTAEEVERLHLPE